MPRLRSPARLVQGASPVILSILLGFSGLVALLLFFWVGGVPLAAFSLCFPLGSWVGWGCDLCFLSCSLASCVCSVGKLGKLGDPARKPPDPHRSCTWLVTPHPSPAGSRRGDEPSTRAVG